MPPPVFGTTVDKGINPMPARIALWHTANFLNSTKSPPEGTRHEH